MKTVTRYSEELQTAILEQLPTITAAQPLEADVSVGGAIADTPTAVEAYQLLEQLKKPLSKHCKEDGIG